MPDRQRYGLSPWLARHLTSSDEVAGSIWPGRVDGRMERVEVFLDNRSLPFPTTRPGSTGSREDGPHRSSARFVLITVCTSNRVQLCVRAAGLGKNAHEKVSLTHHITLQVVAVLVGQPHF